VAPQGYCWLKRGRKPVGQPSRDALIEAVTRNLLDTLDERIAEAETEHGEVRVALLLASLAWLNEGRNWRVARYASLAEIPRSGPAPERIRARTVVLFERGQRDGSVRDNIPRSPSTAPGSA